MKKCRSHPPSMYTRRTARNRFGSSDSFEVLETELGDEHSTVRVRYLNGTHLLHAVAVMRVISSQFVSCRKGRDDVITSRHTATDLDLKCISESNGAKIPTFVLFWVIKELKRGFKIVQCLAMRAQKAQGASPVQTCKDQTRDRYYTDQTRRCYMVFAPVCSFGTHLGNMLWSSVNSSSSWHPLAMSGPLPCNIVYTLGSTISPARNQLGSYLGSLDPQERPQNYIRFAPIQV
jgi:hypothetical protein